MVDIILVAALLGLIIGSFLNVVIYRLPKMWEREDANEIAEVCGKDLPHTDRYNLLLPRSACPHCHASISALQNIPVLSYVLQGGKCRACAKPIGLRYPLVEITTAAMAGYCAWRWGATPTALLWFGFCANLLVAGLIDWDTTLLPNVLTIPLLWLGLIGINLHFIPLALSDAIWGAVGGYMVLWSVYQIFKLLTGREGMGYGDFCLFAALGAWLGWEALTPIMLMASVIGILVWIIMRLNQRLFEGQYMPFGPLLAGAGLVVMVFGTPRVMGWIFAGMSVCMACLGL